jgi:wyosine [tRNA(Phe)-imidazoG37] synthetase (radical SAM superfamily)
MEVFLIAGMNTLNSDVKKIASVVSSINPDRIQLNTAVRPPAEDYVSAVSKEQLEELCQFFHPKAEVIGDYSSKHVDSFQVNQEQICSMIQRRPCTIDQIVKAFNMHMNEVSKYLEKLTKANKIYSVRKNNDIYYIAVR